jgi:flagellar biosynthesis chaperone FliJ
MSALETLHWLRTDARDGAQEAFARRLSELRLAEELLRRANARWESQRGRCTARAEARLSVLGAAEVVGSAVVHARHESRLRGELEVLAFGRQVAMRELVARSDRSDQARTALARAEASLAVLEQLIARRDKEARRRRARREEHLLDEHTARQDDASPG